MSMNVSPWTLTGDVVGRAHVLNSEEQSTKLRLGIWMSK
jgi:hypothetical protein